MFPVFFEADSKIIKIRIFSCSTGQIYFFYYKKKTQTNEHEKLSNYVVDVLTYLAIWLILSQVIINNIETKTKTSQ